MEAATLSVPARSLEQRRAAIQKANAVRSYRAEKKQQLRRGADVLPFLLDTPEQMLRMDVFELLLALPRNGRVKVNRILVRCRISPVKTLGGLSERQRAELVTVLRGR